MILGVDGKRATGFNRKRVGPKGVEDRPLAGVACATARSEWEPLIELLVFEVEVVSPAREN